MIFSNPFRLLGAVLLSASLLVGCNSSDSTTLLRRVMCLSL